MFLSMSIIISIIALILSILSFAFCFKIFSVIKNVGKMQEELLSENLQSDILETIKMNDKKDEYVMPEDTGDDKELLDLKDTEGNSKKLIKDEED